jgi:hypothetical protein
MNDKLVPIMRAFFDLSSTDKEELIKELNRYQGMSYEFQKTQLREQVEIRNKSLGPKSGICPECGR